MLFFFSNNCTSFGTGMSFDFSNACVWDLYWYMFSVVKHVYMEKHSRNNIIIIFASGISAHLNQPCSLVWLLLNVNYLHYRWKFVLFCAYFEWVVQLSPYWNIAMFVDTVTNFWYQTSYICLHQRPTPHSILLVVLCWLTLCFWC